MKERKELENAKGANLELSVQKGQTADFSHYRLKLVWPAIVESNIGPFLGHSHSHSKPKPKHPLTLDDSISPQPQPPSPATALYIDTIVQPAVSVPISI